jgi:hypothetical protein
VALPVGRLRSVVFVVDPSVDELARPDCIAGAPTDEKGAAFRVTRADPRDGIGQILDAADAAESRVLEPPTGIVSMYQLQAVARYPPKRLRGVMPGRRE